MFILKLVGKTLIYLVLAMISIFVIAYFSYYPEYQIAKTVDFDTSIDALEIDSVFYHSQSFGMTGDPILLVIHGGPGYDYKNLLDLRFLADSSYYVVFYDQMGTGLSPRVQPEEISIESYLEDLDKIVDHYRNQGSINILGHGWGGMLATLYSGQNPEKVNKLILAEPGYLNKDIASQFRKKGMINTNGQIGNLWTKFTMFIEALHVKHPDDQAWMDYLQYRMFSLDSEKNPMHKYYCGDIPEEVFDVFRMGSFANQRIMSEIYKNGQYDFDFTSGLDSMNAPVLLMASECNQVLGEEVQMKHMELFNNVEFALIPDSGHLMFIQQADTCISLIHQFLSEK